MSTLRMKTPGHRYTQRPLMDITVRRDRGDKLGGKCFNLEIVNYLLERGADREVATEDGETAVDLVDTEE